jgi:hypothetical protein
MTKLSCVAYQALCYEETAATVGTRAALRPMSGRRSAGPTGQDMLNGQQSPVRPCPYASFGSLPSARRARSTASIRATRRSRVIALPRTRLPARPNSRRTRRRRRARPAGPPGRREQGRRGTVRDGRLPMQSHFTDALQPDRAIGEPKFSPTIRGSPKQARGASPSPRMGSPRSARPGSFGATKARARQPSLDEEDLGDERGLAAGGAAKGRQPKPSDERTSYPAQ